MVVATGHYSTVALRKKWADRYLSIASRSFKGMGEGGGCEGRSLS